jgi:hypothetical protein
MFWILRSVKAFDGDDGPHFALDPPGSAAVDKRIFDGHHPHDEAV